MGFKFFLDRPRVVRAMEQTVRGSLAKGGGYVRKVAAQSMRYSKKPSRPGKPPSAHLGLLKKLMVFAWDASTRSIVIGPERLTGMDMGEAPSVLEHGGVTTVVTSARFVRGFVGQKPRMAIKRKKIKIAARPYMVPAMDKALERGVIPEAFRGSVRGV